ncbi:hypothetical protein I6N95_26505 [Vagococcus sp. BWB3-3]|uniref:Uncharacterized protein n=1 Tax=Vagococcus allomyrinae TaxID=2794353 RepID=A0A940PH70_9ENTE|nr:hypothetical protein [Vagococcus allomyrinae]MBP1044567.1 hypothetical protein [Vagococcus allomyrinae]
MANVKQTRFFEFSNQGSFYYALVKAQSKEQAIEEYCKQVSSIETEDDKEDIEQNLTELSLKQAILEMKKFTGEDGGIVSSEEILDQIADDELSILAVDSSLL